MMDEELRTLIKTLKTHRETMLRLKEHIAAHDGGRAPVELRKRIVEERQAIDRIEAELAGYSQNDFNEEAKPGASLIWDARGKYREQKWPALKERILKSQGGIGIVADDFIEMLRYRPAPFGGKTQTLRDAFAELTRDATEPEDIRLLSEILNYMLREPWAANIDGAWFIYYLEGRNTRDIDLERAVSVINLLHEKNAYAAAVLCKTLGTFMYGKDRELVIDQLLNIGKFSVDVIKTIRGLSLNPPRKGERKFISYPQLFLSYSRSDLQLMRKIHTSLVAEGFKTWTDEMMTPGTPEWVSAIEQAIKDSGALIVVLTPASYQSTWVKREIHFSSIQNKKIFPILAEGDESTSVPIELVLMQRTDIRTEYNFGMSSLAAAIRSFFVSQPPDGSEGT